jgi:hypothetical protein
LQGANVKREKQLHLFFGCDQDPSPGAPPPMNWWTSTCAFLPEIKLGDLGADSRYEINTLEEKDYRTFYNIVVKSKETQFINNLPAMTSEKDYFYENGLITQPSKIVEKNSKGESNTVQVKYPLSYSTFNCQNEEANILAFQNARTNIIGNAEVGILNRENQILQLYINNGAGINPCNTIPSTVSAYINAPAQQHENIASTNYAQVLNNFSNFYTDFKTCLTNNVNSNPALSNDEKAIAIMQANSIHNPVENQIFITKSGTDYLRFAEKSNYEYGGNAGVNNVGLVGKSFTNHPAGTILKSTFLAAPNNYYLQKVAFKYDKYSNVISQKNINDISSSYIYDDNLLYPTAQIANALPSEVAFSSFETNSNITGNWTFSGATNNYENDFLMGNRSLKFLSTGGSVFYNTIPTGKKYILSYWKNTGQVTVVSNGVTIAPSSNSFTKNNWTYVEYILPNTTSDVTLSSSNATIDNLRLYPFDAQMTTYTYEPNIGMTSTCDANNKISFYEYDYLNRLTIIRDQDNILKKICYNYAGQVEDCNTPCPPNSPPNWQNTSAAPVCEQNSCGYTGYQLQQQMDMNVCSLTSGTTRNIQISNTTACPASVSYNINYQNFTNLSGYTATYTDVITGQAYTFSIPASSSGILGCLPTAGKYSLSISKPGGTDYLNFGTGCYFLTGTSAFFAKVSIPACNNLTINWDN